MIDSFPSPLQRRLFATLLAAIVIACTPSTGAAANAAAVVKIAEGDARVETPGAAPRKAAVGETIHAGDILVTGKDGELHLTMQDSGFMVLRPNTRFQVVTYVADGDEKDTGVFRLLAGGVRSITGWIGKFNPRSYKIQTSNATVGIRGTDHETHFIPEGSTEGEPGTYDRVYAGETVIETAEGEETITKDQSGFHSMRARGKPRRLAALPAFFRPGRHEAEVGRMHAAIQRIVAEKRDERRKLLQERRATVGELREKAQEAREQGKEIPPELQARRDALQRDARAARAMQAEILRSRRALEEDVKAGRVTRAQARERRMALQEKEKAYMQAQESINQRLKELNETAESLLH